MTSSEIKKAIITAAGRGTRFLPATKVIPKEMLPIGNYPTIHYLLEECKQSGIEEVAIVVRDWGSLTEDYFRRDLELEKYLEDRGKTDLLSRIQDPALGLHIDFIKQREDLPIGHGSPVLSAEDWIGEDDFGLLFCDDLVPASIPAMQQIISAWQNNPGLSGVVMTTTVPIEQIKDFSSLKFSDETRGSNVRIIADYFEKPQTPDKIFSNELMTGRMVVSNKVVESLKGNLQNYQAESGEFSLWDGLMSLSPAMPLGGLKVEGKWLTTGNPEQMKEAQKIMLGL